MLDAIVSAMTLAAQGALAKTVDGAVRDAYDALKGLIRNRFFADSPKAQVVLEEHEKDPALFEARLREEMASARADHDAEVIAAFERLQKAIDESAARAGSGQTVNNNNARIDKQVNVGRANDVYA